ncbi:hypothetical protein KA531_01795 [Candidatus Saccharibacteria bacterium]|nr:hypothetical protein [Candidatus Saccharibacteria bacterium]
MLQCLDNPELLEDMDDLLGLFKWLQDKGINSARYHDCVEADRGLCKFIKDLNQSSPASHNRNPQLLQVKDSVIAVVKPYGKRNAITIANPEGIPEGIFVRLDENHEPRVKETVSIREHLFEIIKIKDPSQLKFVRVCLGFICDEVSSPQEEGRYFSPSFMSQFFNNILQPQSR